MADNRELHARALQGFTQLVDSATEAQLDAPTPCTEWKVRELVSHVTQGNLMFGAYARGEQPGQTDTPDDVKSAFADSAKIVGESFASEGVNERTFALPFGNLPAQMSIGIHFVDVLVHTWDLAKALGVPAPVPDDLAEAGWTIASMFPDSPQLRGPGGPFGPKVECPDSAPVLERLVAHLGRTP